MSATAIAREQFKDVEGLKKIFEEVKMQKSESMPEMATTDITFRTLMTRLNHLECRLADLNVNTGRIADGICGVEPESDEIPAPPHHPNGILEDLHRTLERYGAIIFDIEQNVSRVTERLAVGDA